MAQASGPHRRQRATIGRTSALVLVAVPVLVGLIILGLGSPLVGSPVQASDEPSPERAVLLHFNDFHGQFSPIAGAGSGEPAQGGARALAGRVARIREAEGRGHVLLFDLGDWFQGTAEGRLEGGARVIDFFNALGVSASTLGNHDLDLGEENLARLCARARFPVLCANLVDERGEPRAYATAATELRAGGLRFAILGVLTPETSTIVRRDVAEGLRFQALSDCCRKWVPRLRESGVDAVVVLSHSGLDADRALAEEVAGIDVIIGAHSHTLLEEPWVGPTHGTLVVQAGSRGSHLGRIDVQRTADGALQWRAGVGALTADTTVAAPEIESILTAVEAEVEAEMGGAVGHSSAALTQPRLPPSGLVDIPRSSALGSWLCRAMARAAGTDIAIHNVTGIRADLPTGDLDGRQLFAISPFENRVVRITLPGSELEELFRSSLGRREQRLEATGLEVRFTLAGEHAELLTLLVGGEPIDPRREYTVATNSFIGSGQGGFAAFTRGSPPEDTGVGVYEASLRYLATHDPAEMNTAGGPLYVQQGTIGQRLMGLLGLAAILGIAALLSRNRRAIRLRPVVWGVILQVAIAFLVLETAPGRAFFDAIKRGFVGLMDFSTEGADMVFGPLAHPDLVGGVFGPQNGFIFFVIVMATIILVSSLTAMLYHIGVMQVVVWLFARLMQLTMRTSGAESLAAAANVFVGQTEAPLTVRPYLLRMTPSEIMSMMCGGMATVAGGVLVAYVSFGIDAGHLLAASVMSAPAALVVAKIMVPEVGSPATGAHTPFELRRTDANLIDAVCRGAGEGMKLSMNVFAMLIAVVSIVALLNYLLGAAYENTVIAAFGSEGWWPTQLTLESVLGFLFMPIAWLLGVPWQEAGDVGSLLGVRMVLNEFVAYIQLGAIQQDISPRSAQLTTYALCGFANFSSIAIQIGGISALEGELRVRLAKLGLLSMLGGTLATLMTAAVAGLFL